MSYFVNEVTRQVADVGCRLEPFEQREEIADGVVARRSVLWLSAGAVAAVFGAGAPLRGQRRQDPVPKRTLGPLTIPEFLAELLPLARGVVAAKGEGEEAYLMAVASALSRLAQPGDKARDAVKSFRDANARDGERFPLGVSWMDIAEGKGFDAHDHLNYDGVILGLAGEVRIRNFDFQGEPPAIESTATFRIRETRDDLILPGRISTLGTRRENIHEIVAGKGGAQVLDVFTFFDGTAGSRYLDVAKTACDADARIYEATWRPRRGGRRG